MAQRRLEQAKLAHQEAVSGFTAEQYGIAEANVAKAAAKIETTKALVDQLTITVPVASEVYQIPVEEGEVVTPGVPLLSLLDLGDAWLGFLLREDPLANVKRATGSRFACPRWATARSPSSRERRVCRLARRAGDRRFRPAYFCDPRLSRREDRRFAPGNERLHRLDAAIPVRPPPRPGLWLVAIREVRFFRRESAVIP